MAEHTPQGGSDIGGRERARRHLIEQRLKKMVVAAVDQGDLHRRPLQSAGCREATKAAAYDHHAVRD
jgi:hypothetical protein